MVTGIVCLLLLAFDVLLERFLCARERFASLETDRRREKAKKRSVTSKVSRLEKGYVHYLFLIPQLSKKSVMSRCCSGSSPCTAVRAAAQTERDQYLLHLLLLVVLAPPTQSTALGRALPLSSSCRSFCFPFLPVGLVLLRGRRTAAPCTHHLRHHIC